MLSIEECLEFLKTREFFTKEVNFLAVASNDGTHCRVITRLHEAGRDIICISKVLERMVFDGINFGDEVAGYSEYILKEGVTALQLVEMSKKVDTGLADCFNARAAELLGIISGGPYEEYE